MAIGYLKNARIYVGVLDLSGISNEVAIAYEAADLDVTTFNSAGATEHMAGLKSASIESKGFADIGTGLADQVLFSHVGGVSRVMSVYSTATEGDRGWITQAVQGNYSPGAKVGDMFAYSIAAQASGALVRANSLVIGAKTTTGNGTAFNLGAVLAAQSAYAALHVVAYSGLTSITCKVQSDDNAGFSSPTDRITFSASTGTETQWGSAAGAISDTYWRAVWTVAGTGSATIAIAMGIQ